jgi:hypothetical protein
LAFAIQPDGETSVLEFYNIQSWDQRSQQPNAPMLFSTES